MSHHHTAATTTDHPDARPVLDTREMQVVHSLFRREVRLGADLVRRVAPDDLARAAIVGRHLDLVTRTLHHHHTTEDTLLWPLLVERAEDARPLLARLQSQHRRVDEQLQEIGIASSAWTTDPTAQRGHALAARYDELHAALGEHLDAEEAELLPVAASHLTRAEWDALGEAGRRGASRSEQTLVLGMMLHEGDPRGANMLRSAPPPVRALLVRSARRAFRRHAQLVHGTATP